MLCCGKAYTASYCVAREAYKVSRFRAHWLTLLLACFAAERLTPPETVVSGSLTLLECFAAKGFPHCHVCFVSWWSKGLRRHLLPLCWKETGLHCRDALPWKADTARRCYSHFASWWCEGLHMMLWHQSVHVPGPKHGRFYSQRS